MPGDDARIEIRDAVVACCDPGSFDAPWTFLPAHDDVLRLPADPTRLLTELRKKYCDETLVAAGVARSDDQGELGVRAKLNAPGELVVILRDRQTGQLVDMLTAEGSVFEEGLPIFSALAGECLLLLPDSMEQDVLVAFSIEDLAVLRACGIPATLAAGLEQMHPADVDRLCATFSLYREKSRRLAEAELAEKKEPRESEARRGSEPQLPEHAALRKRPVLLGWSPAALDVSPRAGFNVVLNHLREFQQHMGIELAEVYAWAAAPQDIDRLRFLGGYQDIELTREALLDSLYDGQQSLKNLGKEKGCEAMVACDLPSAVLRLREAMLPNPLDLDGGERQREALRQVQRLLHEQVVGPMMREAMEGDSATERAIGLAAAQLLQMFLTQSVVINARMAETFSEKGMPGLDALPLERIDKLLKMADRVAEFSRELDRCKQSPVNLIQVTATPQPRPLALPKSP